MRALKMLLAFLVTVSSLQLNCEIVKASPETNESNANEEDMVEYSYGANSIDYTPQERKKSTSPYGENAKGMNLSKYSSVDAGYITSVKNQGEFGTCWTFGYLGAAEATLIKNGLIARDDVDLSEWQLAYFMYHPFTDPLGNTVGDSTLLPDVETNTDYLYRGGNAYVASFLMSGYVGAVDESLASYDSMFTYDTLEDIPGLDPDLGYLNNNFTLRDAYFIPDNDYDAVKNAVYYDGAVTASYYDYYEFWNEYNTAYYLDPSQYGENQAFYGTNHCVMIVGWDDNYPKENFKYTPENNGAWLVKNSWGEYFGEDGYFWLSYEDPSIGSYITNEFDFVTEYDNNYHYDGSGSATVRTVDSGGSVANIYEVKGNENGKDEKLTGVSFALDATDVNYSIQIYTDIKDVTNPQSGTPALSKPITGKTTFAGIYTIDVNEDVILSQGEHYSIVVTLTSIDGTDINAFADETSSFGWVDFTSHTEPNQSFFKFKSGNWFDMNNRYDANNGPMAARIKGLTINLDSTSVRTIKLEADNPKLVSGETTKVSILVDPTGASVGDVTWSSSDESIATVRDGVVTAVSAGTAYIKAKTASGKIAQCQIIVMESGSCGDQAYWTYDEENEILYIKGQGAITYEDFLYDISGMPTKLVIEDGITSIGDYAFARDYSIEEVEMANTVVSIGSFAFYDTVVKKIKLSDNLKTIGESAFAFSALESLTIPDKVTVISDSSFENNNNLIEVSIPSGVTLIEDWAFSNCYNLTNVIMHGNAPTTTSEYAFYNAAYNMVVTIPQGATGYEVDPWMYLDVIEDGKQVAIESIELDSDHLDVTLARGEMFYPRVIFTPENATYKHIFWESDNQSVVSIYPDGMLEADYDGEAVVTGTAYDGKQVKLNVTVIPSFEGACGNDAYWNYDDSTKTLTISGTGIMDSDPWEEESWYYDIERVVVEDGITSIAYSSFSYIDDLREVILPDSITIIEDDAFCYSNLGVIYLPTVAPELGSDVFYGDDEATFVIPDNASGYDVEPWNTYHVVKDSDIVELTGLTFAQSEVQVPYGTKVTLDVVFTPENATFKNLKWESEEFYIDEDHSFYADEPGYVTITASNGLTSTCHIVPFEEYEGTCGESTYWSYNQVSQTLTISGNGPIENSNWQANPWSYDIMKIVVEEGVTSICEGAFCRLDNVKVISVASTVASISYEVFSWLPNIESIVMHGNAPETDINAFGPVDRGLVIYVPENATGYDVEPWSSFTVVYDNKIEITSITLDAHEVGIYPNETCQLIANISPEECADETLTWTSSDSSVAKIDKNGLVTALKPGQTTITVSSSNGVSDSCIVTVIEDVTTDVTEVFIDVFEYDWFKDAVQYVYDHGMMSGDGNTFSPYDNMTRAMMVSTLYRLDGSPEVTDFTATSVFGDVYSGAWFETAVNWSYNEGISVGYPDIMQFGVSDSVTREQLAALLYRYAEKNGYDVSVREDLTDYIGYSEISEYAKDSLSWAVSIGVISGIRSEVDGVVTYDLAPKGYATRVQLASILMRFCNHYGI